jgi:integrase
VASLPGPSTCGWRLAFEAADAGLLSPELAAGIHRVKGVRKLGSLLGNWFIAGEASALWQLPDGQTLTRKRNRAILAILLGCGLRRRELVELTLESLPRREERWAIVDLIGKGRQADTYEPFPYQVGSKRHSMRRWRQPGSKGDRYSDGSVARVNSGETAVQKRLSGTLSRRLPLHEHPSPRAHDLRRFCARLCDFAMIRTASLSKFSFFWGMCQCKRPNYGTLHWLQAAFEDRCKRQARHRTRVSCQLSNLTQSRLFGQVTRRAFFSTYISM